MGINRISGTLRRSGLQWTTHPHLLYTNPAMTDEREMPRAWIQRWKRAGAVLEEQRRKKLRSISTPEALQNLAGAFESCRIHFRPKPYSGLVEQQRWFAKLHK